MVTSKEIIKILELTPHPEGGYFKETYRSKGAIENNSLDFLTDGIRNYSTSIYFLLDQMDYSAFHRIKQDEIWHFYLGSTLLLHTINPNGKYDCIRIGNNIKNGEVLQYVVPAGTWFASEIENKNEFALCGCTVSPGFDFNDFEMPDKDKLLEMFPLHDEIINRLGYSKE
jgi:hypothetical protein